MAVTFTEEVTLTALTCPTCGVRYALPETMRAEKQRVGGDWYCVNGHSLTYGETEVKRLRKALEQRNAEFFQQRENYFAEQRAHEQTQKTLKSLKKRTAAGVCPCCQRTVQQLARHMKTKHVEFVKEHGIPVSEEKKDQ